MPVIGSSFCTRPIAFAAAAYANTTPRGLVGLSVVTVTILLASDTRPLPALSAFRFPVALLVAAVVVGSLLPGGALAQLAIQDKVLHAGSYCLLVIWFAGIYERRRHFHIALVVLGLGVGLLAAFVVAAAMKSALGSSTVAILTTASLVAPLLGSLGLDTEIGRVFAVLAIGAGSMTVSHANDSYFWIITEFSDMETATAYQAWTLATLVLGVSSIIWIVILRNVAGLVL
jgi:hypothetical protein